MSEALEKQFLNPNSELEDFHTRIAEIINYEWDQRQTTQFNKLLKKATLKYPTADFDEAIYEPDRMLEFYFYRCSFGERESNSFAFDDKIITENCIWSEITEYPDYSGESEEDGADLVLLTLRK